MKEKKALFDAVFSATFADASAEVRADGRAALNVIEKKVERLSDVHRRLILAVKPGSGSFLYSKGPKATYEDQEAYNALFSEWHTATRELRKLVEE